MKVIAYDKFKPGVTLDALRPYLRDEVSNVWRLWKAGIVRENYARADVPGVVVVFECASLDEAKWVSCSLAASVILLATREEML